jgi:Flp pilus assembly protein TadD
LLYKLGKLARDKLGDDDAARTSFIEAQTMRPEDAKVREAIASLDSRRRPRPSRPRRSP